MKKKMAIGIGLACLTAGIGLAGCGASNSQPETTTTAETTTVTETANTTSETKELELTLYIDADTSDERIAEIRKEIEMRDEVEHLEYISAEQNWEDFKAKYFTGYEYLTEEFGDFNPLADSAHFAVYLKSQPKSDLVTYLEGIENVTQVSIFYGYESGSGNLDTDDTSSF